MLRGTATAPESLRPLFRGAAPSHRQQLRRHLHRHALCHRAHGRLQQAICYRRAALRSLWGKMKLKLKLVALSLAFMAASQACYAEPAPTVPVKFPVRQEVVPQALSVTIYNHKLPDSSQQPAWSYVTEGLSKLNKPELVMTIVRKTDESESSYPSDPIEFFQGFLELAKRGNVVSAGSSTRLGEGGEVFIAKQFRGTIYLPAEKLEGVNLPKDALAVVPVTSEELDAWDIGGAARVAGKLSQQSQYYPYPTWCDRSRESVFSQGEMQVMKMEPVSQAPTAMIYGAGIIADKDKLSMSVPQAVREDLNQKLKELPKDTPFRLNLSLDPRANAYYVWEVQKATAVAAKGSDASLMSGSFVMVMPAMKTSQFGPYKDGFMLMLTNEDLGKFKEAVSSGKDCALESTTNGAYKSFEVKFSK